MTIQMGTGPAQPANLKRIQGTTSWGIDIGGAVLFPERAPRLRLLVREATEWEAEILRRFAGVEIVEDRGECCREIRESA